MSRGRPQKGKGAPSDPSESPPESPSASPSPARAPRSRRTARGPVVATPFGALTVGRRDGKLVAEWMAPDPASRGQADAPVYSEEDGAAVELMQALRGYFGGDPSALDAIPVGDGTPFQRRVWRACRRIPAGETRTYLWLARRLGGGHELCRAIGQALRRNPLPVVVPCHRVVAGSGLGGYAGKTEGDFAEIKRALLEHEARATGRLLECTAPRPDPRGKGTA